MIWKLDRLGRDLRHLINTVHDLTARNIGLKVLAGHGASIDTTTASGELIFGIFASLAEFELWNLSVSEPWRGYRQPAPVVETVVVVRPDAFYAQGALKLPWRTVTRMLRTFALS